jgi:hypothetical protein
LDFDILLGPYACLKRTQDLGAWIADYSIPSLRGYPPPNTTFSASKIGPSTHTLFITLPSGVLISTAQPAQPPTAQAMCSSSDI